MQARQAALGLVVRAHGAQVEARENVAVEHEERARDVLLDVLEGAGGTEGRFLDHVADLQAEAAAVAEPAGDRFGQIAGREDDVVDAGLFETDEGAFEERHVHDRDHGLGGLQRERP